MCKLGQTGSNWAFLLFVCASYQLNVDIGLMTHLEPILFSVVVNEGATLADLVVPEEWLVCGLKGWWVCGLEGL